MSTHLYHIVFISFKENITTEDRKHAEDLYKKLQEESLKDVGTLFFTVVPNQDLRKNIHLVEVAVFKDRDAFERFHNLPAHTKVSHFMRDIANWYVGDVDLPINLFKSNFI